MNFQSSFAKRSFEKKNVHSDSLNTDLWGVQCAQSADLFWNLLKNVDELFYDSKTLKVDNYKYRRLNSTSGHDFQFSKSGHNEPFYQKLRQVL